MSGFVPCPACRASVPLPAVVVTPMIRCPFCRKVVQLPEGPVVTPPLPSSMNPPAEPSVRNLPPLPDSPVLLSLDDAGGGLLRSVKVPLLIGLSVLLLSGGGAVWYLLQKSNPRSLAKGTGQAESTESIPQGTAPQGTAPQETAPPEIGSAPNEKPTPPNPNEPPPDEKPEARLVRLATKGAKEEERLQAIRELGRLGEFARFAISPLLDRLKAPGLSPSERKALSTALDEIGLPEVAERKGIYDHLTAREPLVRRWALVMFARLDGEALAEHRPTIRQAVTAADADVRRAVSSALLRFLPTHRQEVLTHLLDLMADSDNGVADAATAALEKLQPMTEADRLTLTRAAQHAHIAVRAFASAEVGKRIGDPKERAAWFARFLRDGEPHLRQIALQALATVPEELPGVRFAILPLMNDTNSGVRRAVAPLLGMLGRDKETLVLLQTLLTDADGEVRTAAAVALAGFDLSDPTDLPILLLMMDSSNKLAKRVAIRNLIPHGERAAPALKGLREALRENDPDLQTAALLAVAAIGPQAKETIPILEGLLKEPLIGPMPPVGKLPDLGPIQLPKMDQAAPMLSQESILRAATVWVTVQKLGQSPPNLDNAPDAAPAKPKPMLVAWSNGVVVDVERKWLLCSASALQNATEVKVYFPRRDGLGIVDDPNAYRHGREDDGIAGQVVSRSVPLDVALIVSAQMPATAKAVPLSDKTPVLGTRVATLGFGRNNGRAQLWCYRSGRVKRFTDLPTAEPKTNHLLECGATLLPNSPGAPLLDESGSLVGVQWAGGPSILDRYVLATEIRAFLRKDPGLLPNADSIAPMPPPVADARPSLHPFVIFALSRLGEDAAPILLAASRRFDLREARPHLFAALRGMKENALPIAPQLIQLLRNPEMRGEASDILLCIGPTITPKLVEMLTDRDPNLVAAVLDVLGGFGPRAKDAIPAVKKLIFERKDEIKIRRAAQEALVRMSAQSEK